MKEGGGRQERGSPQQCVLFVAPLEVLCQVDGAGEGERDGGREGAGSEGSEMGHQSSAYLSLPRLEPCECQFDSSGDWVLVDKPLRQKDTSLFLYRLRLRTVSTSECEKLPVHQQQADTSSSSPLAAPASR